MGTTHQNCDKEKNKTSITVRRKRSWMSDGKILRDAEIPEYFLILTISQFICQTGLLAFFVETYRTERSERSTQKYFIVF